MSEVLSVPAYRHHPGHHCETGAARNVFVHAGLDLSEKMLFGLGEGLGFIDLEDGHAVAAAETAANAAPLE